MSMCLPNRGRLGNGFDPALQRQDLSETNGWRVFRIVLIPYYHHSYGSRSWNAWKGYHLLNELLPSHDNNVSTSDTVVALDAHSLCTSESALEADNSL